MDTVILAIISVTLFVILGSVYLEVRRQIKPRIKVYFPDGSTETRYKAKEEASVAIHIKNIGTFGFPKPVATNVSLFIYAPPPLLLKTLQCASRSNTRLVKAPLGGIFGGMHYLSVEEVLNLFHGEEETMTVLTQMPEETGKQTIKVAVLSDEGDLGIHELEIIVF